jgi:23S rRNA maturation-related 3'-5' exoribonuclease YhaM
MTSNDNDKLKMEEEAETSTVSKRLWHTDDDDSSDSPEEEVSSEETSMNQLDTSEDKLFARRAHCYYWW